MNRSSWIVVFLCLMALVAPAAALSLAAPEYYETPVVTHTADQVNPAISGDGVVWQDYRNKSYGCPTAQNCLSADIYHRNLSTGVTQKLTTTAYGMDPDIDGNIVVWRNWMNGKIVVHNLTTGSQMNTSTLTGYEQMTTPAISGNIVVWTDYRNSSDYGDIYMRNLSLAADAPVDMASTDPTIPATKKDKRNPDISGNIVVWEDMRNAYQDASGWWHNPDIYMKNLSTGVVSPVCTDAGDQYYPIISGNKVLWSDYRNGNWDVYSYDITTGVETRVTNNGMNQSWPAVDGDFVVWKDDRGGGEDIYLGTLSTGAEKAITGDAPSQKLPAIDNGRIVWIDNRNGNWDVFVAEEDLTPPVIAPGGPSGTLATDATTLTANYSDGETGIDTGSVVVGLDGNPVSGCSVTATGVSCPVSGLSDGAHTFTVDVSDNAGNAATRWTGGFSVDTTGPVVDSFVAGAPPNSQTASISATYHDDIAGVDAATVSVSVDGNPVSGCSVSASSVSCVVTGQALGLHDVDLSLSDNLGNNTAQSNTFEVTDTNAPIISNTSPTGQVYTASPTISASYSDGAPSSGIDTATVEVTLEGVPLSGCSVNATGVSCNTSGLGLGQFDVSVSVSDNDGNTGISAWSFTIPEHGPVISDLTPANGSAVQNPKAAVSARVTDIDGVDASTLRIYLDGNDVTAQAVVSSDVISYLPDNLADGAHTARVTASDLAGHPAEQVWSFTNVTPDLQLEFVSVYWETYAAYLQRELTVDYLMSSIGTGTCFNGKVPNAVATSGVTAVGPMPVQLGDIAPGSFLTYSFIYVVPHGVLNFRATSYASCDGDGGHTYLFPQLPPQ